MWFPCSFVVDCKGLPFIGRNRWTKTLTRSCFRNYGNSNFIVCETWTRIGPFGKWLLINIIYFWALLFTTKMFRIYAWNLFYFRIHRKTLITVCKFHPTNNIVSISKTNLILVPLIYKHFALNFNFEFKLFVFHFTTKCITSIHFHLFTKFSVLLSYAMYTDTSHRIVSNRGRSRITYVHSVNWIWFSWWMRFSW